MQTHINNRIPYLSTQFPFDLYSFTLYLIGSILGKTWKFSIIDCGGFNPTINDKPCVYCFWHATLLPIAYKFRNPTIASVVSESKDGVRAAAVAQRWGKQIISGSSTHGATAVLRKCTRAIKDGYTVAITPDGPRGPREIVKPGVSQIAIATNVPVSILRMSSSACWRLTSWDKFIIPKPFSTVKIFLGPLIDPSHIPEEKRTPELITQLIQQALSS